MNKSLHYDINDQMLKITIDPSKMKKGGYAIQIFDRVGYLVKEIPMKVTKAKLTDTSQKKEY